MDWQTTYKETHRHVNHQYNKQIKILVTKWMYKNSSLSFSSNIPKIEFKFKKIKNIKKLAKHLGQPQMSMWPFALKTAATQITKTPWKS